MPDQQDPMVRATPRALFLDEVIPMSIDSLQRVNHQLNKVPLKFNRTRIKLEEYNI